MKRIATVVAAMLLMTTYCYAQIHRGASGGSVTNQRNSSSSVFTNISLTGLDSVGNAAYIEIYGSNTAPAQAGYQPIPYYLWVKSDGDLCIASAPSISAETSGNFPSGDWTNSAVEARCTVVGGQS